MRIESCEKYGVCGDDIITMSYNLFLDCIHLKLITKKGVPE